MGMSDKDAVKWELIAMRDLLKECRSSVKFDRDNYAKLAVDKTLKPDIQEAASKEEARLSTLLERIDVAVQP